ncbi:chondroitin sulfate synthase 1-like [Tubulanus polymorphus]|uniref:chondroitin sulfate synthase 1-like n=1 Tax=Tubulanus polymorphus TaxID=672921 RepID=UPI003DA4C15F
MRKIGHNLRKWSRYSWSRYRSIVLLLVGIFIGYFLVKRYHNAGKYPPRCVYKKDKFDPRVSSSSSSVIRTTTDSAETTLTAAARKKNDEKFILVGVMTANKYLGTRAVAVQNTWAKTIDGEVKFFSSADTGNGSATSGLPPVINLRGVDDTYPPQKKSFLMLKYLHDNYIDRFEWFVRSDDDVFIHGKRLATFLRSLNSSKPLYIGQAGKGVGGKNLVLRYDENYCMGGTAIVFSRETLKRIVPHINYCLKHLYTKHEDVEIGRCVRKFAGVQCPWAFEMQSLFYQNHEDPQGSFGRVGKLHEMYKAITMHPVKDHRHLYRMYNHFLSLENTDRRHDLKLLRRDINRMQWYLNERPVGETDSNLAISLRKFKPRSADEVLTWNFLHRHYYSATDLNPRRGVDKSFHNALHKVIIQVMKLINGNSQQKGRTIDYKDILYGYHRVDPVHGVDYIFDLLLLYKKFTGNRKKLDVRRHTYVHQTFADLEISFRAVDEYDASRRGGRENAENNNKPSRIRKGKLRNPASKRKHVQVCSSSTRAATVHLILPIQGRVETFSRFLRNFATTFLSSPGDQPVTLSVMLFQRTTNGSSEASRIIDLVDRARSEYPSAEIVVHRMDGVFSRSIALEAGARKRRDSDLLFFVDVDIYLSRDALTRVRQHTIRTKQVYYPIVFSQYDPEIVCKSRDCSDDPFNFASWRGYWRIFGYGIASIYKSDLTLVGGFNTSIKGWGLEDVDIFDRTLLSSLRVFRAPDPGMIHIFHPVFCDKNLSKSQHDMCIGSKTASLASVADLIRMIDQEEDKR